MKNKRLHQSFQNVFMACCLVIGLTLFLGSAHLKAEILPFAESPDLKESQAATLRLFHRDIFTFYTAFLGTSPELRVKRAEAVIQKILSDGRPHHASVQDDPLGKLIKIDDETVMVITPADMLEASQEDQADRASQVVAVLQQVIDATKQARDSHFMMQAGLMALGATLIFVLVLFLTGRALKWLEAYCIRTTNRLAARLQFGGVTEHLLNPIIWCLKRLVGLAFWMTVGLSVYQWLSYVLALFPQTHVWGEQLHVHLANVLLKVGNEMVQAMPDLLIACTIFILARAVTRGLRSLFEQIETGHIAVGWIDADVARTTNRIAGILVWLFALAMAYPYLPGSDTAAFKGISVLVGLMLSLGASSLVSQAGSGLILTYTRTFKKGEYVAIGEHEGTIVEIGLFNTRIRTGLGVELTLPNALVLGSVTRNYSRSVQGHGFVVDTTVTIGYDTPWRQVHAMLIEAAHRTSGVLAEPPPKVFQTALSDFYPEYRLVCQASATLPRPRAEVISALHANIQDVFNEHEVQIMSPHYISDPAESKIVPVRDWYKPPAAHGR